MRSHPPWGAEYPLPIKKLGVDIVVENQVARVALDQTFHNDADQTLEGVYRFAIPPDAALQRLAMYVDGKLTESAVVERMRARRIYEELVYRRVDPALLEWAGTGRLSLRVYPLPAHQDKRLMLAYTQSLPKLYSDWTLSVPLPEIDQPVGEVAFDVTIKGCANCEVTSTSHKVEVQRKGDDAIVTYHNTSETIGDSLVLHVRDARQEVAVAKAETGGDAYLLVRAPAELPRVAQPYRPRTWVILDDVSASRGAMERRAQADLVDAFMRELDEDDKVAVVAFDVAARQKLAPTRVLDVDRRALRTSLAAEGDVGATDFGAALDAATGLLAGVAPDDAMVVYLGDGVITSGRATSTRCARSSSARRTSSAWASAMAPTPRRSTRSPPPPAATRRRSISPTTSAGARSISIAALHTARVTGVDARLVDASGALVPSTLYLAQPAARRRRGARAGGQARRRGPAGRRRADRDAERRAVAQARRAAGASQAIGGYLPRTVGTAPDRGAAAREARGGGRAAVRRRGHGEPDREGVPDRGRGPPAARRGHPPRGGRARQEVLPAVAPHLAARARERRDVRAVRGGEGRRRHLGAVRAARRRSRSSPARR